jgi:hypothetical protein
MVGHRVGQVEPTEPGVGQVRLKLLAEAPLGSDAEAVADEQYPDHQLGVDREPTDRAVERREIAANAREIDEAVNGADQVVGGNVFLEANS